MVSSLIMFKLNISRTYVSFMEILVQGKVQCVRSDLQTRDIGVSAGTDTNMKQMNAKVR